MKGKRKFTLGEKYKSLRDFLLVGGIGLAARVRGSGIEQSPSNSAGLNPASPTLILGHFKKEDTALC